ncbi:MAG: ABC transporter ATP-binding protein [Pseudomonadota bacterium]
MTGPVAAAAPPAARPPAKPSDAAGRALDWRLLGRLRPFVARYGRALAVSVALLPIISALEVLQPYLLKLAIDEHIAPHRMEGLDRLGVLYLLALVGQYGAAFVHGYLVQVVGQRAMGDLRLAVHRHTLRLSAAFFDRTPVGQLMTRMTNDVESLTELFASGVVSLLGDVVRLGFIIVVMFRTDGRLAAFSMAAVPVLAAIAALFRGWIRDAFREIRAKLSRMNGYLQEHLSGIKVVQAFAQEERAEGEFAVINHAYRHANARAITADAALYSVVEAVGAIAVAALLWRGGARIAGGALTFGVLVQFIEYMGKFFAPLRDLSAKYTVMQQAMAAAERVFALLDTQDLDATPAAAAARPLAETSPPPAGAPAPAVEFDHVTFGYRPHTPILRDLSLTIATGETVAVVGTTGAGKSTLIKLLPRLYPLQGGVIRLGGQDISLLPVADLRRRIVVVSQDVFLFAGTLGDNIGLGDAAIDAARMWEAARRVGADRVIESRAGGLDAPVVERGANFSAGERQLIAFARALARDPRLLILDEATASVDPEFERLIERGIAELMAGRTSIVIAHRLSTVRRADRIVVLDHGRIVEEGHHDALLSRGGVYARLYRLQMQGGRRRPGVEAAE